MPTRIVLTGGPSAGKTTLLALLENQFKGLIGIAPEAATILFKNEHPRPTTFNEQIAIQKSIYELQRDLETQAQFFQNHERPYSIFCDRGSLDGAAYWPNFQISQEHDMLGEFCFAMGTTVDRELERYTAVLHMETAPAVGYQQTDIRRESPEEAKALDARIGSIWSIHPRYVFVPNGKGTFLDKLENAFDLLKPFLPSQKKTSALLPVKRANLPVAPGPFRGAFRLGATTQTGAEPS